MFRTHTHAQGSNRLLASRLAPFLSAFGERWDCGHRKLNHPLRVKRWEQSKALSDEQNQSTDGWKKKNNRRINLTTEVVVSRRLVELREGGGGGVVVGGGFYRDVIQDGLAAQRSKQTDEVKKNRKHLSTIRRL